MAYCECCGRTTKVSILIETDGKCKKCYEAGCTRGISRPYAECKRLWKFQKKNEVDLHERKKG